MNNQHVLKGRKDKYIDLLKYVKPNFSCSFTYISLWEVPSSLLLLKYLFIMLYHMQKFRLDRSVSKLSFFPSKLFSETINVFYRDANRLLKGEIWDLSVGLVFLVFFFNYCGFYHDCRLLAFHLPWNILGETKHDFQADTFIPQCAPKTTNLFKKN